MKVVRGNLVLTDAESQISPAVIAVKDGKIVEVIKDTTQIPSSWDNVTEVCMTIDSKKNLVFVENSNVGH